jgi:hypothetical protein
MWLVLVLHSDTHDKRVARNKRPLVLPVRHLFVRSGSILQPISLFQTQVSMDNYKIVSY